MCPTRSRLAGFVYVWEYRVKAGCEPDFEEMYGPDGDWARFFGRSSEYLGTTLLRDRDRSSRYLTVDRWTSREPHTALVASNRDEFDALDLLGDSLTESEQQIGDFGEAGCETGSDRST